MKVRLLLVAVVAVFLFIGSSASACETCWVDDNFPDLGYSCWSGYETGYQWCYGGGTSPCSKPQVMDCPVKDPIDLAVGTPGNRAPEYTGKRMTMAILGAKEEPNSPPDGGFTLEIE